VISRTLSMWIPGSAGAGSANIACGRRVSSHVTSSDDASQPTTRIIASDASRRSQRLLVTTGEVLAMTSDMLANAYYRDLACQARVELGVVSEWNRAISAGDERR
jgi:hypothetical protein